VTSAPGSLSAVVGVVVGSIIVLLLLVLLAVLFLRRRRKHIRSSATRRRLPTFADVTLRSEIASFLPPASSGSMNGGLGGGVALDFGRPTSTAAAGDVVSDMPPSYDSVVKSLDDVAVGVVQRRRRDDGNVTSPAHRSQARLSLPPISATAAFPGVLRTHRRAESDVEEHIYEDPASLRRSVSNDGLQGSFPAVVDFRAVSQEDVAPPALSDEVDDRSPSELLMSLVANAPTAAPTDPPAFDILLSLPYAITSISSLTATPLSTSQQQPRIPRVRLGTSALYSRPPEGRTPVDWCRSGAGDFPAPASQLRAFSPLSVVGYPEVVDSFAHPYETVGDSFPFVHNSLDHTSFLGQAVGPPWRNFYGGVDPEFEMRSPAADVHSSPSGNRQNRPPPFLSTDVAYFSNDISVVEDRLNSTSSARSSMTESEQMDMSLVSPLFDDDHTD